MDHHQHDGLTTTVIVLTEPRQKMLSWVCWIIGCQYISLSSIGYPDQPGYETHVECRFCKAERLLITGEIELFEHEKKQKAESYRRHFEALGSLLDSVEPDISAGRGAARKDKQ